MPNIISIARWRPLYELARQIGAMAPWTLMDETEIFAVYDPESDQTGYVSIMGSLGEHRAIDVYLGNAGLRGFLALQDSDDRPQPTLIMSTPQLQLSFEEKGYLEQEDLFIIYELEYKPQDRNMWPMFRCYRPGFAPWFLENDEISFLQAVLEQTLAVLNNPVERKQVERNLVKEKILVREGRRTRAGMIWTSETWPIYPPDEELAFIIDAELGEAVRWLPKSDQRVFLDLQILLTPIQEKKGERPGFAYLLAFMDAQSELMLHFNTLTVKNGWHTFMTELPEHILRGLKAIGARPKRLLIRDKIIFDMMTVMQKKLGMALENVTEMPAMDAFVEGFYNMNRKN
jgi:hypothetical protein